MSWGKMGSKLYSNTAKFHFTRIGYLSTIYLCSVFSNPTKPLNTYKFAVNYCMEIGSTDICIPLLPKTRQSSIKTLKNVHI